MLADTMKQLSDHQILDLATVMLEDDHRADDSTATYVAAFREAQNRPTVWSVLTSIHPNLEATK